MPVATETADNPAMTWDRNPVKDPLYGNLLKAPASTEQNPPSIPILALFLVLRQLCAFFFSFWELHHPQSWSFSPPQFLSILASRSLLTWNTMASALRLSSSALRASLKAPSLASRHAAFTAARCYSSKTQVLPGRLTLTLASAN